MRVVATPTYLKTVPFTEILFWDTKRYTSLAVESSYPIVSLGTVIAEQKKKYKLDEPETEYGILGVNNKEGIFDAYLEKGKKINQAYKKMEVGWIAYNPYRINVGSIGIRLENHTHEYISPAYVVFSCKEQLLPEYLFLLFKTDTFNRIINENTTGSVRQNLKFDTLSQIKIPLPSITEQQKIVTAYKEKLDKAHQLELDSNRFENEIESYLLNELGITKDVAKEKGKIHLFKFSELVNRWDKNEENTLKSKFPVVKTNEIIKNISTGTTPPTTKKEYFQEGQVNFYTPADLGKEKDLLQSERKVTQLAIEHKKARKFEYNTLLFVGIGSTVGKVGIVKNDFATSNQQITGIVFNEKVDIDYIYIYFDLCKHITIAQRTQATIPIVNQDKILEIPVPLPSIEKQKEIANKIAKMRNDIKTKQLEAIKNREAAIKEFEQNVFGE